MNYGNSTTRYQLRTPALGDLINPDEEQRTKQIIDNQLFGAIRVHSGGDGVIRLGDLSLINPGGGTYTVQANENNAGGKPSIEAFINQIYVYQDSGINWSGLSNNTTYYLYVQLIENGTQSSLLNKQVTTSFDTIGNIPSNGLLVAAVIVNEPGNSYLVPNPVGKVTIPVLGDHIVNNQNPHTPNLYQDDLNVSGINILDTLQYRQLQVDQLIISGNQIISGNITCLGQLIVSGTIAVQGTVLYNELATENMLIPGNLIVGNIQIASGLDVYPQSLFQQNIQLTSGVTIDGLDPSLAIPLINGSNADALHTHNFGSLSVGTKPIFFSPEYANTIISGTIASSGGSFHGIRANNNNYYQWSANQVSGQGMYTVTRLVVPPDFSSIDRLQVTAGVSPNSLLSGGNVQTFIYDKDFTNCLLSPNGGQNLSSGVTTNTYTVSGGQFLPYYPATIVNRMVAGSGTVTWLGDMAFWYVPINGEKIIFDWNKSGASIEANFNGPRIAPQDLRIEKIIVSQYQGLSGNSVFDVNLGNIAYGNTTPDLTTWLPEVASEADGWDSVCYSPDLNLFVAVTQTGTHQVMTSSDGVNWVNQVASEANNWNSVCWASSLGLFVAVAGNGTHRVMTSSDGVNWSNQTAAEANQWVSVCWSPDLGLFVAVAVSGTHQVMTSTNGTSWSTATASEANNWNSVCWASSLGLFVAVAINGTHRVMTSTNGTSWSNQTAAEANQWQSVCWSPQLGLLCAVSFGGTHQVMTSSNGTSWSTQTAAEANQWVSICWSPEAYSFIAVASSGTHRVMTSTNGTSWIPQTAAQANSWASICWSSKLLIAVAVASSGSNRVMISNTYTVPVLQSPTTIFPSLPKPTISYNPLAISGYIQYFNNSTFIPTTNFLIPANSIITASMDLVASGSTNLNLQLITHRL